MAGKGYDGSCFCGAVKFTVTGEPAAVRRLASEMYIVIY